MYERASWVTQSSLISEDGVYSINWNEFCFEKELQAIKISDDIYLANLQSYNDGLVEKRKGLPSVPNKLENFIQDKNKLQRETEESISKAKEAIEKYRILNTEIKNLKTKKAKLEQSVEENEQVRGENEEYQKNNKAYNIALPKYCKNFDLDVSCTITSESTFEASMKFKSKPEMNAIKLLVDKVNKKILEFDASEIFTKGDSKDLSEKIIEPKNVPHLLCRVRDHVFKLK